jgi:hypothetical protein
MLQTRDVECYVKRGGRRPPDVWMLHASQYSRNMGEEGEILLMLDVAHPAARNMPHTNSQH